MLRCGRIRSDRLLFSLRASGRLIRSIWRRLLERIVEFANVKVISSPSGGDQAGIDLVREGYPTDHLPPLSADDIVYACGPAHMIETLSTMVAASKVQFYSDPFEPATKPEELPLLKSAKRVKRFLVPERGFQVAWDGGVIARLDQIRWRICPEASASGHLHPPFAKHAR